MDRSIYKYFVEELLLDPDSSYADLPVAVIQSPWNEHGDTYQNLVFFLENIFQKIENPSLSAVNIPSILTIPNNTLSEILKNCHVALVEILAGTDSKNHHYRCNGIQLLKFLTYCGYNGIDPALLGDDCLSMSMFCFLIEGLLFCGWCPDSFDGFAKRSAHEYCITLKKAMSQTTKSSKGTILGYLWGDWVLAEKTEGIRVSNSYLPDSQKIEWNVDGTTVGYCIKKSNKPHLFYMLQHCQTHVPHPYAHLHHENQVGLFLSIDNEPLNSKKLVEYEEVLRIKKNGYKFCHECSTQSIEGIQWTSVFFSFQKTFYRIDVLTFPECLKHASIQAELRLEIPYQQKFGNSALVKPLVEFIDNPFKLQFTRILNGSIALYSSTSISEFSTISIQMATAWSMVQNAIALDRTHLLGIYD